MIAAAVGDEPWSSWPDRDLLSWKSRKAPFGKAQKENHEPPDLHRVPLTAAWLRRKDRP